MSPFYGTYSCKIDSKGRFNLPARYRREFMMEGGETLVVTKGTDGYLILYTPEGWRSFQEKLGNLPAGPEKRKVIRYFSSNSTTLNLDKQGRVGVPRAFLAAYEIDNECLVVGALDHIEVWKPEDFDRHLEGAEEAVRKMEHLL